MDDLTIALAKELGFLLVTTFLLVIGAYEVGRRYLQRTYGQPEHADRLFLIALCMHYATTLASWHWHNCTTRDLRVFHKALDDVRESGLRVAEKAIDLSKSVTDEKKGNRND